MLRPFPHEACAILAASRSDSRTCSSSTKSGAPLEDTARHGEHEVMADCIIVVNGHERRTCFCEIYYKTTSLQHWYHGPAKFCDRSGGTNKPDLAMACNSLRRHADRAAAGLFFRNRQADFYTLGKSFQSESLVLTTEIL